MVSRDGRFVLTYNGELYNHQEIRAALITQGPIAWRGSSDTETLLEAVSTWGLETALGRCNGMFAFALWDRASRELHLARDRMGEKPLYWGKIGSDFVFASELKALHAHPGWTGEVDRDAVALFLRHDYVPSPYCIHKGIQKLPAAHWLTVSQAGKCVSEPKSYWSLEEVVERGGTTPFLGDEVAATDKLESLMKDAVKLRMMADVPLGAFLSGGYDSSTVVALMQAQSDRPVQTFTIGYHEKSYNEAEHAKAIAAHLGTDHTELYVTSEDARAVIPELPRIWDEPFSDSSQIPTLLVSRLARRDVTVSLSGDGGDELFCGYGRYQLAHNMWSWLRLLPYPLRQGVSAFLERVPPHLADGAMSVLPPNLRIKAFGDRLAKLAAILNSERRELFYRSLVSHTHRPETLVRNAVEPWTLLSEPSAWPVLTEFRDQMMYIDSKMYLTDDILTKLDRASMAVSLESRVPLLDHRLVEFAWSLPIQFKHRRGQPKWILREVLSRYVPRTLTERPKMGFRVPIEEWLRGPLRDWAESLLSEDRLRREGFFSPSEVRTMWQENQAGARRWHSQLWNILMFQAWQDSISETWTRGPALADQTKSMSSGGGARSQ